MDFIPLAFLEWAPAKNVSDRWAKYLPFYNDDFLRNCVRGNPDMDVSFSVNATGGNLT
jgi:hypothetical protein